MMKTAGKVAVAAAVIMANPALAQEAAPAGTAATKYCMKVEPVTGSRLEKIQCWTRAEWAYQGVDVDRDWAAEGVRTIG